jgi:hypothetical protein
MHLPHGSCKSNRVGKLMPCASAARCSDTERDMVGFRIDDEDVKDRLGANARATGRKSPRAAAAAQQTMVVAVVLLLRLALVAPAADASTALGRRRR